MTTLSNSQNRWKEEIKAEIQRLAHDHIGMTLVINDFNVVKFNDQELSGITIINEDGMSHAGAPTFYLDSAYLDIDAQIQTPESIARMIYDRYIEADIQAEEIGIPRETPDLRKMLNHGRIAMMVCDANLNQKFLTDKPSVDLDAGAGEGFKAVFSIVAGEGNQYAITITDAIAKELGMDAEALYDKAIRDLPQYERPCLLPLSEAFSIDASVLDPLTADCEDISLSPETAYMLRSGSNTMDGSAFFFYPGMREKLSELLNDSYYVLPSSRYEFMIYPETAKQDSGIRTQDLCAMVRDINRTVTKPEEKMSDFLFHYDAEQKTLETVVSTEWPYLLSLKDLEDGHARIMNYSEYHEVISLAVAGAIDFMQKNHQLEGNRRMPAAKFIDDCKFGKWATTPPLKVMESIEYYFEHSPYFSGLADRGKILSMDNMSVKAHVEEELFPQKKEKQIEAQKEKKEALEI